jgi:hypothetical protein
MQRSWKVMTTGLTADPEKMGFQAGMILPAILSYSSFNAF